MERARQATAPAASATRPGLGGVRRPVLSLRDRTFLHPPLVTTGSVVVSQSRAAAAMQRYPQVERALMEVEIGRRHFTSGQ
jgi:hypothetical protein